MIPFVQSSQKWYHGKKQDGGYHCGGKDQRRHKEAHKEAGTVLPDVHTRYVMCALCEAVLNCILMIYVLSCI